MNYSNITGFILALSLTIQFFSGLLPSSYYEDYVVLRFDPAVYTMIDVNNGWTLRFLHVLGASLFMLFVYFHFMRGSWLRITQWIIYFSTIFYIECLFIQYQGHCNIKKYWTWLLFTCDTLSQVFYPNKLDCVVHLLIPLIALFMLLFINFIVIVYIG